MDQIGRAYAFFDANDSQEEIEASFGDIREYVQSPDGLDLKLYKMDEFTNNPNSPKNLVDLIAEADVWPFVPASKKGQEILPKKLKDLTYVLEVNEPNVDNSEAASHTGDIANGIYALCNDEDSPFYARIVFEEDGQWIERIE